VQQSSGKSFNINEQIKSKEVRVIDENGKMLGVISLVAAIKLAEEAGLDLVEVSPNVAPPVCKIANFGKMKYELQKKASDSKKKQKVIDTKEVKLSVNIGKSDYDVKVKQIIKFIEKGDKVKVSIKIKGREMAHLELADQIMVNISNDVEEYSKFESKPKMEGKQMIAILVKK
jgi:translation initiation factor IF-3